MDDRPHSFWTSLPTLLTAIGTLIAAVTGAVALYLSAGNPEAKGTPAAAVATQPGPPAGFPLPEPGKPPFPPPPFGSAGK